MGVWSSFLAKNALLGTANYCKQNTNVTNVACQRFKLKLTDGFQGNRVWLPRRSPNWTGLHIKGCWQHFQVMQSYEKWSNSWRTHAATDRFLQTSSCFDAMLITALFASWLNIGMTKINSRSTCNREASSPTKSTLPHLGRALTDIQEWKQVPYINLCADR